DCRKTMSLRGGRRPTWQSVLKKIPKSTSLLDKTQLLENGFPRSLRSLGMTDYFFDTLKKSAAKAADF
ncbi:MAG: hypothetical protein IJV82_04015, partial [Oscillospiraceae bacterium]|nr:hypothetical protein [Oscillospiraceae bacterium]